MKHLKGIRFGLPFIKRIGVLNDKQAHRIQWNSHAGLEVHFVLKGMCTWEIADRDESVAVPGGAFMVIPAGVRHRPVGENAAPSKRIGVIYETAPRVPAAGVSLLPSDLDRLFRVLEFHAFSLHAIPPGLLHILKEIRNEVEGFTAADNGFRLRTLNELLLVETARTLEDGGTFLPRNGSVVQQVCEWIGDHLDSRFTIGSLIKFSGYGRSRFFTLFVKETGMSPNDYVVRQRIERAQVLLREDDRSILAVALACGFKSASTFSTTFAKFTGLSPRAFRNECSSR